MTRRSYIRIVSFIFAILFVLIAFAIINTNNMRDYKQKLETSYQQSLGELSGCLEVVNTDLTKTLYSNSDAEIYNLSRDLYAQCSAAKNAVSRLPVSQLELNNIYKFLSQAADYSQYIANKIENGEKISKKEHESLKTLLKYAEKFSNSTDEMVSLVQKGAKITEGEVKSDSNISSAALKSGFSSGAKTFESFPTLLYDGPFSDQVLNKKSKLVSQSDVKTKDECKDICADALNVSPMKISFETDEKGKLPSYTFKSGRYTVSVTKQGGFVKSILYSGAVTSSDITRENAVNIAKKYLSSLGFTDMKESYYSVTDNVLTANFAYCKNGVYCYSDLIKCGVSLSDGRIISLDTSTYLTNHIVREKFSPKIKSEDAKKLLSPYLTVNSVKKSIIPKKNGKEVQCWEFDVTSKDTGEDALIYINCDNGKEEDIMLLLYTDEGTLVK